MAEIKLIRMYRSEAAANGGPVVADVHPDEIENYERGGWQRTPAAQSSASDADEPATPTAPLSTPKARKGK